MTQYFQRLLFMTLVILSSSMLFSLCGCARMSGFVMNESGQAYYARGNYALARQEFQKALIDDPTNANYAFNLAAAAQKQGDYELAERGYRQALSLNPSYQPAYHGLASLMMEQGRSDEAQQLLSAWVGSQPYVADSYVEMAWLQRELGDPNAAEQTLRQALQVNPQHDRAIAQLGQVYEEQGRTEDAVAMYQRSLYLDPTQSQVKNRLASLKEQLPETLNAQQMHSPAMMAATPWYSPGMVTSPQMASFHPQTYPVQTNPMIPGQSPFSQVSLSNAAVPAGYGTSTMTMQTMQSMQPNGSGQWAVWPSEQEQAQPAPMMAPPANEVVQQYEQSSEPTTLVVPPVPMNQTPASNVPQVSQNLPQVQAF